MFFTQGDATYAMNAATGKIIWTAYVYGSIAKIDDTHMMVGSTCLDIATGRVVWEGPDGFSPNWSMWVGGAGYVPELKMFLSAEFGWSLPDATKPPVLVWNNTGKIEGGAYWGSVGYYGDGKIFYCLGDGQLHAISATTGKPIWQVGTEEPEGWTFGALYHDGILYHGEQGGDKFNAWNTTNGQLIWQYSANTFYSMWGGTPAYYNGIIYCQNQNTYTYALNATTGELIWKYKGPGVTYVAQVAVADGKIYFQSGESQYRDPATGEWGHDETVCVDAYTGEQIWSLPIAAGSPNLNLIVAYGNVYLVKTESPQDAGEYTYACTGHEVWCIGGSAADWSMFLQNPSHDAIGYGPTNLTLDWKFSTDNQIFSSPTCSNGIVYFGNLGGNIFAVNATTGTEVWNFTANYGVRSSVAVVNNKLYTGADDGNIYCLNANTGQQIWKTYAGNVTNTILTGGMANIRSSPIVSNGLVYVGSLDGNLYCLDANSGAIEWSCQTNGEILSTPTVDGNIVYVTSSTQPTDGTFLKLDADTGAVIWNISIPYELEATWDEGNYLLASPTVADDLNMVFVSNGLLYTYAFNITSGAIIWTYKVDSINNSGQSGGVLLVNSPLYHAGSLYMNNYTQ